MAVSKKKAFERAAELLQQTFLIFREATFDETISWVQRFDVVSNDPRTSMPMGRRTSCTAFFTGVVSAERENGNQPGSLFVALRRNCYGDEKEKQSLLCWLQCEDAVAVVADTAAWLLEG